MIRINQYEPVYGQEEAEAVFNYLVGGGWCGDFKYTRQLEDMIKSYTGSKYCLIVNNGTSALTIAVMAFKNNRPLSHDIIFVPDYTMPATAYAVSLCNADVGFVDVDKDTYNTDFSKYEYHVIMPVHINGRYSHGAGLSYFSIEDACQGMGSTYNGKHLGTFGNIGILSLNMFKLISTGQGGVILTDSEELYLTMKKIKDYGRLGGRGAEYEILGMNAKFNDLLAVIGIEQFKKIAAKQVAKEMLWTWYTERLAGIEQVKFVKTDTTQVTPWYIDPLVEDRDGLIKYLDENGIETQPFYVPLHRLRCYKHLGYQDKDFPNSCYVADHGIWLPSSMNLSEDTVDMICDRIKKFYENN